MKPIRFKGVEYNTPDVGVDELIYTVDGGIISDLLNGSKILRFTRNVHTGEKWIDKTTGGAAPKFFQDLCNVTVNKFLEIRARKAADQPNAKQEG